MERFETDMALPFSTPFDDWHLSLWDELRPIEKTLDKKFKRFEHQMDLTRKNMLHDMKKMMSKDIIPSENTYVKSQSNVESSTVHINGITFRFRFVHVMKERDGIRIPHIIKQVFCHPGSSIELLQENATLKESINEIDSTVLT